MTSAQVATNPSIRISQAEKRFVREDGTTVHAIDGIDLEVGDGEFVVLLGPSGCGKTTLLRSIAGLEELTRGRIEARGRTLFDSGRKVNVPTESRHVGMMFQSYALWPHLTVEKNISYPLVAQRLPRAEIRNRVDSILDSIGISELRGQYPSQISGGQQQRVALARALVAGNGIVLFDEPLSNVDARVRDRLRGELKRLHAEMGFTAVYVTHDQDEALALATTVVVLESGKVAQRGEPRAVYREPNSPYVARFMGSAGEIAGTVRNVNVDGSITVQTGAGPIRGYGATPFTAGDVVTAFIRPESWRTATDSDDVNVWSANLTAETFHGYYADGDYDLGGETVRVRRLAPVDRAETSRRLHVGPADVRILVGAS